MNTSQPRDPEPDNQETRDRIEQTVMGTEPKKKETREQRDLYTAVLSMNQRLGGVPLLRADLHPGMLPGVQKRVESAKHKRAARAAKRKIARNAQQQAATDDARAARRLKGRLLGQKPSKPTPRVLRASMAVLDDPYYEATAARMRNGVNGEAMGKTEINRKMAFPPEFAEPYGAQ